MPSVRHVSFVFFLCPVGRIAFFRAVGGRAAGGGDGNNKFFSAKNSERIPAGGAVLDMMSSWVSHLPPEVGAQKNRLR